MDRTKYPTKTQILSNLYIPTKKEKKYINEWKIKYYDNKWKNYTKEEKIKYITFLIYEISMALQPTNGQWLPNIKTTKEPWSYNQITKTINIDQTRPSIISTLHELGHHFHGTSELIACQYSTGIFKTCFPKTYRNLRWEGHMLKAK